MNVYHVFVSYSRADRSVVKPLVELLRITETNVFRDEDSIRPGKEWKVVISEAIESTKCIVVFWTARSAQSDEVDNEVSIGISLKKDVVPVLLDDTPLTEKLSNYQSIDFRGLFTRVYSQVPRFNEKRLRVKQASNSQLDRELREILMMTENKNIIVQSYIKHIFKEHINMN